MRRAGCSGGEGAVKSTQRDTARGALARAVTALPAQRLQPATRNDETRQRELLNRGQPSPRHTATRRRLHRDTRGGGMAQACNMPSANGGDRPLHNLHTMAGLMNGWRIEGTGGPAGRCRHPEASRHAVTNLASEKRVFSRRPGATLHRAETPGRTARGISQAPRARSPRARYRHPQPVAGATRCGARVPRRA